MKPKTIDINIHADDVRSFMAEFLAFAFLLQSSMEEQPDLTYLAGCPVSREIIGTTFMAVLENLSHMGAIDSMTMREIARNINESVQDVPMGLRRPTVLM